MSTVINTPATQTDSTANLVGIILFVVALFFLLMYGLPALRQASTAPTLPEKVNVNVGVPQE